MKKCFISLFLFSLLLLNGCTDLFEYHPADGRVSGETNINAKNIEKIEAQCSKKTTLRVAVMSDTQRHYDETEDFVNLINSRNDIDFVIHTGDITDFGLTKEFLWMRDILNKLTVPYVVVLGNHDCIGNANDVFKEVFGDFNFSFLAGNTKFVCLNTNALEFDYSVSVPDFDFIINELNDERPEYEKTIVAMHAPPYSEQFNNNVATVFQHYINEFRQLQFCVYGHIHHVGVSDLFDDGVLYYSCGHIASRNYLLFTITPDGYTYESIDF